MLYVGIILAIMYTCLTGLTKLEKKDELKKAKEEAMMYFLASNNHEKHIRNKKN